MQITITICAMHVTNRIQNLLNIFCTLFYVYCLKNIQKYPQLNYEYLIERIFCKENYSSKSQPHQPLHGTQALNHRQTKHLIKILVPHQSKTGTTNAIESAGGFSVWYKDAI